MKYTIVVDKQSRANPSNERREITFEIDELRKKGDIHDDFIIENGQAKVIRRIALSKYNVTSVLENEVIEELGEAKIPLFEGDNYIYVKDEYNNQMCAEYIVKSDFTDMYVTRLEMNSAIEENEKQINLFVSQKLEGYSTTEETKAMIDILSNQIALELTKKVNGEDITGTSIILMINENKSSAKINADMITLTANDVLNLLANNEINLTSNKTTIKSTNFSVDASGKITATSGEIGGFALETNKFSTTISGLYEFNTYDMRNVMSMYVGYAGTTSIISNLYDLNGDSEVDVFDAQAMLKVINGTQANTKNISGTFEMNTNNPKNFITIKNGNTLAVSIGVGGINTHLLSAESIICGVQTGMESFAGVALNGKTGAVSAKSYNNISLESIKKNITRFDNALKIIKNSEIYEYNFKTEEDTDKKHVGFVIGDKYNTPEITKSNDGKAIENYTMSAINWRGLQEALEIIESLNKRISVLEEK